MRTLFLRFSTLFATLLMLEHESRPPSFLWLNNIFHCLVYHIWFICSFTRHLCYFHFLAILNNDTLNMSTQVFLGSYIFSLLGIESLGHMVNLCLPARLVPKLLHHFTTPPAVDEGSSFSMFLPTLATVCHLS